jgi:hypothetical protein
MEYYVSGDDGDSGSRVATRWHPGAGSDTEGYLKAAPDGVHYLREISLPKSARNEDDGVFNDTDEIFAVRCFVDADGGRRQQVSNVVTGNF